MTPNENDEAMLPAPRPTAVAGFRPHGRTEMWAVGAIVHVVAEGPFNCEGVDVFSQNVVALYRRLPPGGRFVNLTEFHGSMMATPEAWERLASHLGRFNESGLALVATAWIVADDVEGRGILVPRATTLFHALGRVFEVFDNVPAAEEWAKRQLAT